MTASFLQLPAGEFLELVAAREAAPGGGAVAAVTAAGAAALAGMAARFSDARLPASAELADQADSLRHRLLRLAAEDAAAYSAFLAARALPRDPDPQRRADEIQQALRSATEVPAAVASAAADVARLALQVARDGNPSTAGDAITAVLLSEAATRSAAMLVRINIRSGARAPDLAERAAESVRSVAQAAEQARALS